MLKSCKDVKTFYLPNFDSVSFALFKLSRINHLSSLKLIPEELNYLSAKSALLFFAQFVPRSFTGWSKESTAELAGLEVLTVVLLMSDVCYEHYFSLKW